MKKKIVIASVLKPTDDVRSFWKLSQSMSKTNKYAVNIIGNGGKKQSDDENITFHPHFIKRNNWLKRILIREIILFRILKLKPSLLIITTHELINTALIVKLFIRCKVVYDVQENYKQNLTHLRSTFIHKLIAFTIRWKENMSRSFIDAYWLAEKCYETELPFTRSKFQIIENKAFKHPISSTPKGELELLFSGTISDYGGVKRALSVFEKINKKEANASLTIIGQVHDIELREWLEQKEKNHANLYLKISDEAVSYEDILNEISAANLGIIGYEPNAINQNKLPTKLYEYSLHQLPYLVQKNTKWSQEGIRLGGAIPIDFNSPDIEELLEKLKNPNNLFVDSYPEDATWEYESKQMINSLISLM